jgi:N-acetylglutamate synthase-like GNAT family acetyltransferase
VNMPLHWGSWSPELNVRNSIDGCKIIFDDGHDVGCVTVEKHSDHLWLDELFIGPAFQRRGIGSNILWSVIADAKGLEIPLRLSVLTTNPALDFYLRHGLRIYRETAERHYLARQCDGAASAQSHFDRNGPARNP